MGLCRDKHSNPNKIPQRQFKTFLTTIYDKRAKWQESLTAINTMAKYLCGDDAPPPL